MIWSMLGDDGQGFKIGFRLRAGGWNEKVERKTRLLDIGVETAERRV